MTDGDSEETAWIARLSERVLELVFARQYDQAREAIESARQDISSRHIDRLISLASFLENEMGHHEKSINLMRAAIQRRPNWPPHLYQLSVFLMDMGRLSDADLILDQLISLCERTNDPYFLDDARFRKIICLKALEREEEIAMHKEKLPTDASSFIGNRLYKLTDLD